MASLDLFPKSKPKSDAFFSTKAPGSREAHVVVRKLGKKWKWEYVNVRGAVSQSSDTLFGLKSNARRNARLAFPDEKNLLLYDAELKRTRKLHDVIVRVGKTGSAARVAKAKKRAAARKAKGE